MSYGNVIKMEWDHFAGESRVVSIHSFTDSSVVSLEQFLFQSNWLISGTNPSQKEATINVSSNENCHFFSLCPFSEIIFLFQISGFQQQGLQSSRSLRAQIDFSCVSVADWVTIWWDLFMLRQCWVNSFKQPQYSTTRPKGPKRPATSLSTHHLLSYFLHNYLKIKNNSGCQVWPELFTLRPGYEYLQICWRRPFYHWIVNVALGQRCPTRRAVVTENQRSQIGFENEWLWSRVNI